MDLVRFGLVVRALRRRQHWRQVDLARGARVSQGLISLIERGHASRVSLDVLTRVAAALGARTTIDLRWRGGELDRLLDEDHAALAAVASRWLTSRGWDVRLEVTYAVYSATGSIDILAWHEPTHSLLVIEIKTEVTSAEATIRKLDEKVRLGAQIALDRFGWRAVSLSRLLVIESTSTARRRVTGSRDLFDAAFPARVVQMRRWLAAPAGSLSGLMFLSPSNPRRGMSRSGGRHRIRPRRSFSPELDSNVGSRSIDDENGPDTPTILTGRT